MNSSLQKDVRRIGLQEQQRQADESTSEHDTITSKRNIGLDTLSDVLEDLNGEETKAPHTRVSLLKLRDPEILRSIYVVTIVQKSLLTRCRFDSSRSGIEALSIEPASLWEGGCSEIFNDRSREELLVANGFRNLAVTEARWVIKIAVVLAGHSPTYPCR